ncbi:MAG: response regulator [Bacteroidales bacterium]|nr:response regulator [Bacteroidales bacterium]HQH41590.1 response regulator [Bacteroidales bacterium]
MKGKSDQPLVLVIDDSNTNVVLLDAILNDKGIRVKTALNVMEAEQIMDDELPDLILLDLLMPKINGYDFLKKLKSDPQKKDIPVIVVTAVSDHENLQHTLELGAISYFIKPIDIQELISKVQQVLHIS